MATYFANLDLHRLIDPEANGGCIGDGLSKARWEICWMKIFRWSKRTHCIVVWIEVLKHRKFLRKIEETIRQSRERGSWTAAFPPRKC